MTEKNTASNTSWASGGLQFHRESSCGLSLPNAKPQTVTSYFKTTTQQ